MMDVLAEVDQETRQCHVCEGEMELERDGEYIYWACECGTTEGYRKAPIPQKEDTCAIGVPEGVRQAASNNAMSEEEALQMRRKAFVERIGMGKPE